MNLERDIILALRQVYDPEIPVNIYDLGLVYELKVNEAQEVYIQMTFTAPTCPMADYVMQEVEDAVKAVPGVMDVKIDLVFEPAWDKSRMSEEARLELGLDDDDDEPMSSPDDEPSQSQDEPSQSPDDKK